MSGHLLKTVNPEAAAEADSGWKPAGPPLTDAADHSDAAMDEAIEASEPIGVRGLPSVGMDVVYHLRDGDARNMRTKFPAVILSSDPETRTVSLVVMVDAGDLWRQDRVPQYAPPEAGWDWIEDQVSQELPTPNYNVLSATVAQLGDLIIALTDRIATLEAKRGPGRPPNQPKE